MQKNVCHFVSFSYLCGFMVGNNFRSSIFKLRDAVCDNEIN